MLGDVNFGIESSNYGFIEFRAGLARNIQAQMGSVESIETNEAYRVRIIQAIYPHLVTDDGIMPHSVAQLGVTQLTGDDLEQVGITYGVHRRGSNIIARFRERNQRSIVLLKSWLSPKQREQYERNQSFTVAGCDTGKKYEIRSSTAYNIKELDCAGDIAETWCIVPAGANALGDIMLAQKIALETDETETMKKANPCSVRMNAGWPALLQLNNAGL